MFVLFAVSAVFSEVWSVKLMFAAPLGALLPLRRRDRAVAFDLLQSDLEVVRDVYLQGDIAGAPRGTAALVGVPAVAKTLTVIEGDQAGRLRFPESDVKYAAAAVTPTAPAPRPRR